MITSVSDMTPEMYNMFLKTRFQPSWYQGERYNYVEQLSPKDMKTDKKFFFLHKNNRKI